MGSPRARDARYPFQGVAERPLSLALPVLADRHDDERRSITVDVDHGLGKGQRGLLRHVVTDALQGDV
jgi:hypothetical protein